MKRQLTDSDLIRYIDGELPVEEARAIDEQLAAEPAVQERLESLRNLRVVARDAVRRGTPPVPAALRDAVQAMAREFEVKGVEPSVEAAVDGGIRPAAVEPVRMRPARVWLAGRYLAAAAVLILLAGLAVWVTLSLRADRVILVGREASGLTARTVSLLQARHLKCAMMGNNFEDVSFPKLLKDLGPAVRAFLDDDVEAPDLTDIGLEFAGAGPCDIPGGKTLHWLYRSREQPGVFVSLFVQPYAGQVKFPRDTAVVVSGPTTEFPLLVWRSEWLVFYLIGDDFGATAAVAGRMNQSFGG